MVKISDTDAEAKYNIINTPSLVYFRKRVPLIYDGEYSIFFYLVSQFLWHYLDLIMDFILELSIVRQIRKFQPKWIYFR